MRRWSAAVLGLIAVAFVGVAEGRDADAEFSYLALAERLAGICDDYKVEETERRRIEQLARRLSAQDRRHARDLAAAGVKLLTDRSSPDLPARSMACLMAAKTFGPFGSAKAGLLVDDPAVVEKRRRAERLAAEVRAAEARARTSKPVPPGVTDGMIVIDADPSRPDRLTGYHSLRLGTFSEDGRSYQAGCVPCFNAMTLVAVVDGQPYAINGLTRPRHGRYWVANQGRLLPVRDVEEYSGSAPASAIKNAQSVKGCAAPANLLDALAAAQAHGVCMGF